MTDKGQTNRKWTSTPRYREGWGRVFGGKDMFVKGGKVKSEDKCPAVLSETRFGLKIIKEKHLPEHVILFADDEFFYWQNLITEEMTKIPKSELLDLKMPFKVEKEKY